MLSALSPNIEQLQRVQREDDHTHLVLRLKIGGDILPLPIYLHGVNRVYFTFTLLTLLYFTLLYLLYYILLYVILLYFIYFVLFYFTLFTLLYFINLLYFTLLYLLYFTKYTRFCSRLQ
jgi:hypothetical protein